MYLITFESFGRHVVLFGPFFIGTLHPSIYSHNVTFFPYFVYTILVSFYSRMSSTVPIYKLIRVLVTN